MTFHGAFVLWSELENGWKRRSLMQTIGSVPVISATWQRFTAVVADLDQLRISSQPIRNYEAEAEHIPMPTNGAGSGVIMAIQRWLSKGNIRLEFYSSNEAGGIRVKIISQNAVQVVRDMSMQAFLSLAPGISISG
jgi:hypothetical protein